MKREKTMNRIKNLISISAFSIVVLCLPAIALAQWGNGGYNNGGNNNGGNNNGGYNNGQYGNYGGDMRSTVRDLKNLTRELQRHLDRDLDNSRYNGSRKEDQYNDLARRFRDAVNRLSESNNNYGNYGRRDDKVDRVLELGSQLDRALSRARLDYHIQEVWSGIRNDLQTLGNGYGSYNNNNNNRNNRNNNGGWGNGGNNRPSWWPF